MQYKEIENSTKIILKLVLVVLILAFAWVIRDIIIILLLSVVLASALDPLVEYLNKHKIPRVVSVLAVYILGLGLIGLVISLLVGPAIEQTKNLSSNLPQLLQEFQTKAPILGQWLSQNDLSDLISQIFNSTGSGGTVFARTLGVFNGVFTFVTVLVISFYLVSQDRGMKQFIRSLVPAKHQDRASLVVEKIQKKMGLWVLGQLILSLFIFALTFIGLTILGVKYALFLALLAGILEIVPYIGPILSAIPSVAFAFIQSPPLAVAVALLYLLVQKTESYILVPKVMQKTIGLSPLLVLVAVLVGFKLAGILGLLLAVPLAGAISVLLEEFLDTSSTTES